jgi:hypothetical protein
MLQNTKNELMDSYAADNRTLTAVSVPVNGLKIFRLRWTRGGSGC